MDNPLQASSPEPLPAKDTSGRWLLNLVLLACFVVAATVDAFIGYTIIKLVIFSYSGHDPTSVNGLAFPIALFLYIVVGVPALGITALIMMGYLKTRPEPLHKTAESPADRHDV